MYEDEVKGEENKREEKQKEKDCKFPILVELINPLR